MKKNEKMKKSYLTSDLYLSAFLHTSGLKLLKIERVDGHVNRALFCFEDTPKRIGFVTKFYNSDIKVNAKKFVESLQTLKSALFNL